MGVTLQGTTVTEATEFKYLGSTVQQDGGSEKEVSMRVQAGWNSWRKECATTSEGKNVQNHGEARSAVWYGGCSCHRKAGTTNGSGGDEDVEILSWSHKERWNKE